MSKTVRLIERVIAPLAAAKVDREAGVIRGALLCGTESANRRRYPWKNGLTCNTAIYENRVVNIDHGTESTVPRRIGWTSNITEDDQGRPRGDVHILTTHPYGPAVLEAAEKNPSLFGLSHVAVCRTRMDGGTEIVEEIKEVESVDIVGNAATTQSFYESIQAMKTTLRKFLESAPTKAKHCRKWAKLKTVAEMDGYEMAAPVETDPDEQIKGAFSSACMQIIMQGLDGEMEPKAALSKLKKLLAAHADIQGEGDAEPAAVEAEEEAADEAEMAESKGIEKGKKLIFEAIEKAVKAGLSVTRKTVELAVSVPDLESTVKAIRESTSSEKAKTSGRGDSKTVVESQDLMSKPVGSMPLS